MKRVLVTGATGFLGSHLLRTLVRAKDFEIVILKRSFSNVSRISNILDKVTCYDIDTSPLDEAFSAIRGFDFILHTATAYGRHNAFSPEVWDTNVAFPLKLMNLAGKYNQDTVFFNTDTYFNTPQSVRSYDYLPEYILTKQQVVDWGKLIAKKGLLKFVNLRLFHVYGPDDSPDKFTTFVLEQLLKSSSQLKLTLGEQRRDFIFVDDAVSAYLHLIDHVTELKAMAGSFINLDLGCGEAVRIRDFVELAAHVINAPTRLIFGAVPYRQNEIMVSKADIQPMQSMGWTPLHSLDQGIRLTVDQMRSNL